MRPAVARQRAQGKLIGIPVGIVDRDRHDGSPQVEPGGTEGGGEPGQVLGLGLGPRLLDALAGEPVDQPADGRGDDGEGDQADHVDGAGDPEAVQRLGIEEVGGQDTGHGGQQGRAQAAQQRDPDHRDQGTQQGPGQP